MIYNLNLHVLFCADKIVSAFNLSAVRLVRWYGLPMEWKPKDSCCCFIFLGLVGWHVNLILNTTRDVSKLSAGKWKIEWIRWRCVTGCARYTNGMSINNITICQKINFFLFRCLFYFIYWEKGITRKSEVIWSVEHTFFSGQFITEFLDKMSFRSEMSRKLVSFFATN